MPETSLRLPTGRRVPVDVGPDIAGAIERSHGRYERHLTAVLEALLVPDAVAFDVGANSGAVTLAMAALAPEGRVVAFEAASANADRLDANVRRCGFANVQLERTAVYDRTTELAFSYSEEESAGASVSSAPAGTGVVRVPAVSLDDYLRDHPLDRLDLIKIDVEGSELRVLRGARATLERLRPTLLLECNPVTLALTDSASVDALARELTGLGYRLGWITGRGGVVPIDVGGLHQALSARGIVDVVASIDPPRGAQGLSAWLAKQLARARVRLATTRSRAPRNRFVSGAELRLQVAPQAISVAAGQAFQLTVSVTNTGPGWLSSTFRRHPVLITHRWEGDEPVEERTALPKPLRAGGRSDVVLVVRAPSKPGERVVIVRAVQEGFAWLDAYDAGLPCRIAVTITPTVAPG